MSTKREHQPQAPQPKHAITRRDALKTGAAVGATAALGPLAINSVFAETPNRGGHFKSAANAGSATDTLDPTLYVSQYLFICGYFWGNALVRLDSDMNLVPELAESWDVSPDAKTWVLKLRQGVEFHNGKSLTADDVVWTINRHRAEEAASGLKEFFAQMTELKATGPDEVTFVLEAPNADWLYVLTDFHLQIQPQGEPTDKGLGTGPYVYESFDPGVRLLLKRNPNYWKSDAAYFDSVEHIAINDPTARVSALQTGDVHFINNVPAKIAGLLEKGGFNIHRVDSTWFNEFIVHTDAAPFDNNDMRLALKYAVDREEILDKVMFGAGQPGNDHPVPTSFRFHASGLAQKSYDLDKVKFHYKKTGHSGPLPPLHCASVAFPGGIEAAELFQRQAAKAGINFDIQRVPEAGYWSTIWDQKPFFESTWAGRPTEDQILSAAYHSAAGYNETNWNRPDVDKLLLAARQELDVAKRTQLYHDIQELVSMEGGAIIPQFQQLLFSSSKKLGGFYTSPIGDGNFVEHMYFKS